MEWLKRLGAAIDYIEENLDKEISYDEAAHIACCSTYYFQRIFSYVSGVSLSEYIRRRKMTQAAFELQRTDNKVIDVAHKYGYSSPTSFNRAFQSVHGIAPIAAKSMGCTLCAYPSIQFSIIVLGGSAMAYHIEEKKSIRIIGIRIPLVEDAEENMRNVPAFWKKAVLDGSISKLAELSNKNPDGILGVSVYNNPEDIYYYIAVSSNIPVPEGMVEYMIPGAVLLLHIQAMAEQYTVEIMTYHLICVKEAKVKSMHRKMETGSISLLPLSLTAKKE